MTTYFSLCFPDLGMSEWGVVSIALEQAELGDTVRFSLEPRWPVDYEDMTPEVRAIMSMKCTHRVPDARGEPNTRYSYWYDTTFLHNFPAIRRNGLQGTRGGAGDDTGSLYCSLANHEERQFSVTANLVHFLFQMMRDGTLRSSSFS